jgi:tRNA threonylcarbamoyladenosine biosynthesis protein TsaE
MNSFEITSHHPKDTLALAASIATKLKKGSIVCLHGDLGSGKTTFVQGLAAALGVKETVQSPTFVLMNMYEGRKRLFHFDLYRLENIKEIERLGYEEFFYGDGIAVVEWADKLKELYPPQCLVINFAHAGNDTRDIRLEAKGAVYGPVVKELAKR